MPGKAFSESDLKPRSGVVKVHDASGNELDFDMNGYSVNLKKTVSSQCQIWYYDKSGADKTIAMKRHKHVDGKTMWHTWTYHIIDVKSKMPPVQRRQKKNLSCTNRVRKNKVTPGAGKLVTLENQQFSFLDNDYFKI